MITLSNLEVEIKLKVSGIEEIKSQLKRLGFSLIDPEYFESNIVFDTPDGELKQKGCLLRLRQKKNTGILTFKKPVSHSKRTVDYKIREEIESRVSDFNNTNEILLALGFKVYFIYEKYREVYQKNSIILTIDRTPIGNFIEIEGREKDIDEVAGNLGYTKKDFIVESYYTLFRKEKLSGFMTFK